MHDPPMQDATSESMVSAPSIPAPGPELADGYEPGSYPRPQLRRDAWTSLDGPWSFALDAQRRWTHPSEVVWDRTIEVPFAPETRRSGIGETGFIQACWYRRVIATPALTAGERVLLHFGAV